MEHRIAAPANATGLSERLNTTTSRVLDPCRPLNRLPRLDRTGTPFLSFASRRQATAATVRTDLLTFRGDKG
jgi:hypothetical protein